MSISASTTGASSSSSSQVEKKKLPLSLTRMSFEEHMLYSTVKFHANNKFGTSLANLLAVMKQARKYDVSISHFELPYKTESSLATALKPFVDAKWMTTTTQQRTTKYFVTPADEQRAFATGGSSTSEEADSKVIKGMEYLYTLPGAGKYHEFPAICWASSLAGGSVSSSLHGLLGKGVAVKDADSGTTKKMTVINTMLAGNRTVFWGLRVEDCVESESEAVV